MITHYKARTVVEKGRWSVTPSGSPSFLADARRVYWTAFPQSTDTLSPPPLSPSFLRCCAQRLLD